MNRVLKNCYDSHVHWLATGEHSQRLVLSEMKDPGDIKDLPVLPNHRRGEWIVGWGWDQNNWDPAIFPNRQILDEVFPKHPAAFTRADGHALWVNSAALLKLTNVDLQKFPVNQKNGRILRDDQGDPTGILIDHAMALINDLIPAPTASEIRHSLLEGVRVFNRNGFTHIRDLSCSENQWNQSVLLEQRKELTLAVEQYFDADPIDHYECALQLAKQARQEKTVLLRPKGIKVYYDGALGSEGALLSHPYRSGQSGLRLMTIEQFKEVTIKTWEEKFDLAIHVIGDQAAHEVAFAACDLWNQGYSGCLHLEHAEMMRPETIHLLRNRDVICHMQPCHWLTDRKWLHHKVQDLSKYAFPWAQLEQEKISFDFGSDSPIEPPRLMATIEGMIDSSSRGVQTLQTDPLLYHEHPDHHWTPDTFTEIENGIPFSVQFLGRRLTL
jgi:predicted amidohydrolase YtcJ